MKLPLDDGDQHVGGHGAPDLRLHGILAVADETFDAQMLLDPLEEQLDLPTSKKSCKLMPRSTHCYRFCRSLFLRKPRYLKPLRTMGTLQNKLIPLTN